MKNFLYVLAFALIAASPTPKPTPVVLHLPTIPMHTDFVVEVNAKGQVVRVEKGTNCKSPTKSAAFEKACYTYNAQTYGNALQMWIRHPDGSAEVGRYRITYDYDPKTHLVHRGVTLVSAGGDWGGKIGAADDMINTAERESREAHDAQSKNLPPLENIVGPTAEPTPHA